MSEQSSSDHVEPPGDHLPVSNVTSNISVVQNGRKDKAHMKTDNIALHSMRDWQNANSSMWNPPVNHGTPFTRYPPPVGWPPVQGLVHNPISPYPHYPPPIPFSPSIPPPPVIANQSNFNLGPISNISYPSPHGSSHISSQVNYSNPFGVVPNQSAWNYFPGPPPPTSPCMPVSWNNAPPLPSHPPPAASHPPPLPTSSSTSSRSGVMDENEFHSSYSKLSSGDKNTSCPSSETSTNTSGHSSRSNHYPSSSSRRSNEPRSNLQESKRSEQTLGKRSRSRESSRSSRWSPLSRRSSRRHGEKKSESREFVEKSSKNKASSDRSSMDSSSTTQRSTRERSRKESGNKWREPNDVNKSANYSNAEFEPCCDREFNFELGKETGEEATEWIRCSPANLYYQRSPENNQLMVATPKLIALHDRFKSELLDRVNKIHEEKPPDEPVIKKPKVKSPKVSDSSGSESGEMSFGESSDDEEIAMRELERKKHHPDRLHEELWYNDPGEMNDGPLCRCSLKARRTGIRHGIYPGETHLEKCDPHCNNIDRLFHYRITMSPHTNFLTKFPTVIRHDDHEFIFEGFSMLSHYKIGKLPTCKVIRFNIEYTIHYLEEKMPDNFTICGIQIFSDYLFKEILELVDLDFRASADETGCKRFHFFPRFARAIEENGKEILSMNVVQKYLLDSNVPLVNEADISRLMKMNDHEWQNFTEQIKGMIVTYPGKKPSSIRVDQLDRDVCKEESKFPEIVHFGIRPLQLSYAGNPSYQKAWREYVKYRHLLANKPKVSYQDRHKLMQKEMRLQEMRTKSNLKRDVTVVVSSKGFYRTGIMCDIVQHAMLLPVLVCHLRFHKSLDILEDRIGHKFEDRFLLQLALTHPSYRENFGTNPDHARNALTNCGIRQPEYGDRRIHYANTRKRGINTLINIMSRFGKPQETVSNINHNERLEFLGDAVVEFLTSIHLFHLFPDIEEGGLATYRAAIVQNQHLAVLAKKLQLDHFMLYAHGSDLCHDLELRHAMANCFEALMGALFLDGEVEAADRVFCNTLFSDPDLLDVWVNYPSHPIQEQEPDGDRQWIASVPLLKKVMKFEDAIGVEFNHIRLLARAFTHRSVGYNNLTLGSNQRLEFLGDTVLQLVASEYLYKFFPEHHEGHLSLLRSSLVNNRTQSVVCDDLGMVDYAIYAYPKGELKIKDRADLLEAFLGALYVDQGLEYCRVFCQVCFFPRLQHFIMNQDWNDPKSKLQQCCLTLRTMDGGEPDIPFYKVIESKGPTNTRIFTVAVYFRGKRLAKGSGHSIQQAEMEAANKALKSASAELFPQLNHQRRVIERSLKQHQKRNAEMSEPAEKVQPPENPEVVDVRKMSWCI